VVELTGRLYWKQMSNTEWESKVKESIIKVEGVHTKKELEAYCAEILNNYHIDIYNGLPWRFFIIENYE